MLPARAASRGNSANTFSNVHGSAAPLRFGSSGDEIFARGEIGKDLPPFGHQSEAELGDAISRKLADFAAGEADRAGTGRRQAP